MSTTTEPQPSPVDPERMPPGIHVRMREGTPQCATEFLLKAIEECAAPEAAIAHFRSARVIKELDRSEIREARDRIAEIEEWLCDLEGAPERVEELLETERTENGAANKFSGIRGFLSSIETPVWIGFVVSVLPGVSTPTYIVLGAALVTTLARLGLNTRADIHRSKEEDARGERTELEETLSRRDEHESELRDLESQVEGMRRVQGLDTYIAVEQSVGFDTVLQKIVEFFGPSGEGGSKSAGVEVINLRPNSLRSYTSAHLDRLATALEKKLGQSPSILINAAADYESQNGGGEKLQHILVRHGEHLAPEKFSALVNEEVRRLRRAHGHRELQDFAADVIQNTEDANLRNSVAGAIMGYLVDRRSVSSGVSFFRRIVGNVQIDALIVARQFCVEAGEKRKGDKFFRQVIWEANRSDESQLKRWGGKLAGSLAVRKGEDSAASFIQATPSSYRGEVAVAAIDRCLAKGRRSLARKLLVRFESCITDQEFRLRSDAELLRLTETDPRPARASAFFRSVSRRLERASRDLYGGKAFELLIVRRSGPAIKFGASAGDHVSVDSVVREVNKAVRDRKFSRAQKLLVGFAQHLGDEDKGEELFGSAAKLAARLGRRNPENAAWFLTQIHKIWVDGDDGQFTSLVQLSANESERRGRSSLPIRRTFPGQVQLPHVALAE